MTLYVGLIKGYILGRNHNSGKLQLIPDLMLVLNDTKWKMRFQNANRYACLQRPSPMIRKT